MHRKAILICLDALGRSDLDIIATLPNFRRLMREGAYCLREYPVYPSITFPCHASIATGCFPSRHGIINNYIFDPYAERPQHHFYAENIKVKALWDYAREDDKSCASIVWPAGVGPNLNQCLPDLVPDIPRIWNDAASRQMEMIFAKYASPPGLAEKFFSTPGLPQAWLTGKQPDVDRLIIPFFLETLRESVADITLFHVYGLDTFKHKHGTRAPGRMLYLELYDELIGRLLTLIETSSREDITLFVTGDHSAMDVTRAIHGNMVLAQMGLCTYRAGRLVSWRAFLDSCDGMAHLYAAPGEDARVIADMAAERFGRHPGVAAVFYPPQIKELGCDPSAVLALEAAPGWGFENAWNTETDRNGTSPNNRMGLHGYLPTTGEYQTIFFACGRSVAKGREIPEMNIIDIMPTICDWMDIPYSNIDGNSIKNLFL